MPRSTLRPRLPIATVVLSLLGLGPAWAGSAPLAAQSGDSAVTAIRAGALFDGTGETIRSNVVIVVRDGRIEAVGEEVAIPDGASVVDLSDWTVLPGLIDLHTHLTGDPADLGTDRGAFLFQYPERPALVGVRHARTTLLAGFTTVRDVGAPGSTALALRDAIADGLVPGPRMITAIGIGTTGSHCDPTTGVRPGTADVSAAREYVFDGPQEAEAVVRRAVRDGADLIKVCATAGVLSLTDDIGPPQMTSAELEAVVRTASSLNRRVAAHAHGLEGIQNAVRAGITTIDHASILDEEIIEEMKARGTWIVPTMMAFDGVVKLAEAGFLPPGPTRKTFDIVPYVVDSHRLAIAAGAPIAFGTDAGVFPHGENAREFQLMEAAGMSSARALLSATRDAAAALGRADLGVVEAGRWADLIAVRGDPLDDLSVLMEVGFVMKEGVVVKEEGVAR